MGFWDMIQDNFLNLVGTKQRLSGSNQMSQGAANQQGGAQIMQNAAGTASDIAGVTPEQYSAAAGRSGAALGEQMGSQAADVGTQKAIQAARTSGLNKGEAAITGAGTAGQNFVGGQQTGELAGMGAYGQGAQNQLNATSIEGTTGANLAKTGTEQYSGGTGAVESGNKSTGALLRAFGDVSASGFEKGGIVTEPTAAVVGEKGPEVVLPLDDPKRIEELLKKIGLVKGAAEVKEKMEACPTCGQPRKSKEPAKEAANV